MKFEGMELLMVFSTIIILTMVVIMALLYSTFLRKRTDLLLKEREKELKFEQELALSQVEIKEQTLSYIGRELHDDLGQKLSVAKMMNNKFFTAEQPQSTDIAKEMNLLIGECINDIRNLSKMFITDQVAHFGLLDSLEREVKRIKKLGFVKVELQTNVCCVEMDSKHAVILFRILQECLNNALKHSKAKSISISVNSSPEILYIAIKDDGIGMVQKLEYDGVGIRSMKKRAEMINADFKILSEKNNGTEIIIQYTAKRA
ncbi:hypothetical protein EIZ47_09885 [Chryseobacterium lacus]|uniref:histidine kinase n=1 Tax=Chryseobacterium lacus TaxID=2058346 RepID=A0A368MZ35_9FLAO|nr:ATP-binding protein [Chryseobacterium lacus]RCU42249.1 hypothetical protein DQ356_09980 [Chryseobacterium lacus]RST26547.1 hypothetical protein EIZ47_09885 [Chryseobacterium lacus]